MAEEEDLVASLLSRPFSKRSKEEQRKILNNGRPTPSITLHQKEKTHVRSFNNTWYVHHKWMTASKKLNRIFCWPCLLLAQEKNKFSSTGYTDLKNMSRTTERHCASKEHLTYVLSYRKLLNQDIKTSTLINKAENHTKEQYNKKVKINREIFKKIIDITCFLSSQYCIICSDNADPLDNSKFRSLLELTLSSEEHLLEHYRTTPYFSKINKSALFEIIQCVNELIKGKIGEIVNEALFYAVVVDDASDVTEEAKFAVFVRLVNTEGILNDFFLGFHDMDGTPECLATKIKTLLNRFDLRGKLVSLALDGSVLNVGTYSDFENILRQDSEQATLTHCFSYKLTFIAQQICYKIEGVKSFFAAIESITTFFKDNIKRQEILNKYFDCTGAGANIKFEEVNSQLLNNINSNRLLLIEILANIHSSNEFNFATIKESGFLKNKLGQTDFIFYLLVFKDIFEIIENFEVFLKNNSTDVEQCWQNLMDLINEIENLKNDSKYNQYIAFTYRGKGFLKIEKEMNNTEIDTQFKKSFFEILDNIKTHLLERFSSLKKLNFILLGDVDKMSNATYHDSQLSATTSLENNYGHFFNKERLKNELETIYSPQHKQNFVTSNFFDLIQDMVKSEYNLILPEIYKMFCLLGTIPYCPKSQRNLQILKKFKGCSTDNVTCQNLNAVARLFYETDILAKLKLKSNFYDSIIDKFARRKETKIQLLYKQ